MTLSCPVAPELLELVCEKRYRQERFDVLAEKGDLNHVSVLDERF